MVKGVALQPVGQRIRTGYQPGLLAFALNLEHRPIRKVADPSARDAQGLGDPPPRLEESQDLELIPGLVAPLAGLANPGDFRRDKVGENIESPGHRE
jgi:hypothetical protein